MGLLGPADATWLETWFTKGDPVCNLPALPFEAVMASCPDQARLRGLLQGWYGTDVANPIHEAFAEMASCGLVEAIVTTNYDRSLEAALRPYGHLLHVVIRDTDLPAASPHLLFKIHGSADTAAADTMVFSLEHEGTLAAWKRDALRRCISGRPLVITGYSGLDFDICPELIAARPRQILWNFLTRQGAADSPGLQRVLAAGVPVTVLIGDMTTLLGLLGRATSASKAKVQAPIADELRHTYSLDELLCWRARILNRMGHARLALATTLEIGASSIPKHAFLELRAQALFHKGAYVRSAQLFNEAALAASSSRDAVVSLLHACDAARCAGRLRWARELLTEAESRMRLLPSPDHDVRGLAALKAILVARDSSLLSGRELLPAGRSRLCKTLEPLFRQAAEWATETGQQFDFQQLELWRRRLGLPKSATHLPGSWQPEDPRVGYRHLGFPVAAAMDLCDAGQIGQVNVDELHAMWRLMRTFGCWPQSWKIGAVLLRKRKVLPAYDLAVLARDSCRCQYTLRQRIAQGVRVVFSPWA